MKNVNERDAYGISISNLGIEFETTEETNQFVEVIKECLEVRIRKEMGKDLNDKQLDDFNGVLRKAKA